MNDKIKFLPGHSKLQKVNKVSGYYFFGLVSEVSELISPVWRISNSEQILTCKPYPEPCAF